MNVQKCGKPILKLEYRLHQNKNIFSLNQNQRLHQILKKIKITTKGYFQNPKLNNSNCDLDKKKRQL